MTVLLHVSDTHGELRRLDLAGVDAIVHSGDFFPNLTRGNRFIEPAYQHKWAVENAERLRAWTGGAPLFFIPGNHDYLEDAEQVLRDLGIAATDLTGHVVLVRGHKLYGFPWVTYFNGEWNYEVSEREIAARLDAMPHDIDVLVSHGPLRYVRDANEEGEHCGSEALRAGLLDRARRPRFMLHGHIHESFGVTSHMGMLVSNAATVQHKIALA